MNSGLYKSVNLGLLVSHEEAIVNQYFKEAYKVIQPELIPFVSILMNGAFPIT